MVSVFLGFVFGEDPTVKMLGLGLATAIVVDATLVRMVLVPSAMALMGDPTWWLPAPLARLLPHVYVEAPPVPQTARLEGPVTVGSDR